MSFRVGLEKSLVGPCIAWVLGHPGCFSAGLTSEQALDNLPVAIQNYIEWIYQNDNQPWLGLGNFEFHVEETWQVYRINEEYDLAEEGYDMNAWFLHDWKPLTNDDIQRGLKLLSWSRALLLSTVSDLKIETLEKQFPGERWSIHGILGHVGGAEWWYLDRLGMSFPRQEVPQDPMQRLEVVRNLLNETLPRLDGSKLVLGVDGEFWSPRKLLRRAVWHELDHVTHIQKLLS